MSEDPTPTPPSADGGATEVSETVESCPRRIINARWAVTPVKCGDNAQMLADTENIPANTSATFDVKKISDNSSITTINSNTTTSSIEGMWESQKPSENWNGAEVKFTVAAAGEQADSGDEQLSFHSYPDIARQTRTHNRTPVGYAAFTGRYTIEFTDRQLIVKVRVKLLNKQAARPANRADYASVANGPPVADAQKRLMKRRIQRILSKRLDLHRWECARENECNCPRDYKCCKFEVIVRVYFVESNEHHVVNLWPGSSRHDAENWHVTESRTGLSWAHETGHLLGWYDEYAGGGTAPAADNPRGRWQNDRSRGIMGPGRIVYWDHLEDFRSWFVRRSGENWRLINR